MQFNSSTVSWGWSWDTKESRRDRGIASSQHITYCWWHSLEMFNGRIQLTCVSCLKDAQKRKCEKEDMFLNLNIEIYLLLNCS